MTNSLKDLTWKLKMLGKEPVLLAFIIILIALLTLFVMFPLFMILRYSISTEEGRLSLDTVVSVLKNSSYRTTF